VVWNRLVVTLSGLVCLSALLALFWLARRILWRQPAIGPHPVWVIAVLVAPLLDWMLVLIFSVRWRRSSRAASGAST